MFLKTPRNMIRHVFFRHAGRVDAIHVNPEGFLFGGADKRGDDKSLGF
jgi:hypothetical protein